MSDAPLTGRCLCGDVRFEVHGKVGPLAYCHCQTCRRANGTAFAANAPVRAKYLKWISGRDGVREFESSPGKFRAFCSRCGSPVYSRSVDDPDTFRIRLGTVDGDPGPPRVRTLLGVGEGALVRDLRRHSAASRDT